ncbi:uncharacterized protein N7515_002077 [Penicillium bovifimosum]|uniref:DUF7703 domain-containing protein n=1 Tax=Penicillium bovifimosum TaxID=126998 RepID=A0A9W9HBI1_9EURO|nr:uncharacterized protein N7515_002077 [Penicillium bovifimosum]KAJ5143290.1 hypothetical protein N7515_002077 [Penicillium bovifimosum]
MAVSTPPSTDNNIVHILSHRYGPSTLTRIAIFASLAALAWYNAIELIALCFISFQRYRGTYFWSLLIASSCIIPHCLGYVLLFFPINITPWLCISLITVAWCGMVTGQSVVLWSRLHLVLHNRRVLRGVLWMICVDAVLFHVPTIVTLYGFVGEPESAWARGYEVTERVQLVGFCVQELVISGIYVFETVRLLRLRPEGRPKGVLEQLLVITVIILVLDVAVVVIEYVGYYDLQVMFKPVAYSIKLKLEFAILGKLVAIVRAPYNHSALRYNGRDFDETTPARADGYPAVSSDSSTPTQLVYTPPWQGGQEGTSYSTSTSCGILRGARQSVCV